MFPGRTSLNSIAPGKTETSPSEDLSTLKAASGPGAGMSGAALRVPVASPSTRDKDDMGAVIDAG